jgi:hypothetical protein
MFKNEIEKKNQFKKSTKKKHSKERGSNLIKKKLKEDEIAKKKI